MKLASRIVLLGLPAAFIVYLFASFCIYVVHIGYFPSPVTVICLNIDGRMGTFAVLGWFVCMGLCAGLACMALNALCLWISWSFDLNSGNHPKGYRSNEQ